MKGRELNEFDALKSLSKKGCTIKNKTIFTNGTILGNGSFGLIDFLVEQKGYTLIKEEKEEVEKDVI